MNFEYEQLINRQRQFFLTNKTKDIDFRIGKLKILKQTILKRIEEINKALENDLRKGEFETFSGEIMVVIDEINMAIKKLKSWAKPEKVKTSLTYFKSSSYIYREPYGIVLIMTAWNYPFQLAFGPLIGALAAGNCCIIKPSELAPNTSLLVCDIIRECFEEEYCTVVEGGVEETTALLKERFDFILYTGSTRVGKIIAQAAAKHLTPIVLEMGGKSPCIVDNTANIEISARRIAWGKFTNAGQICVAPDYILVHKSIKDPFIEAMKKQIRKFYGEDPKNSPDYCRIINENHFDRILKLLNDGNIVFGGRTDKSELYIEPTIIDNVKWENPIMQEEIFGPIMPIIEYENLEEVIDKLHTLEKPLALYVFSKDKRTQRKILKEVSFGGGCINATVQHLGNINLPIGGVGNSGMGKYHGKIGFDTFSNKKGIMDKSLLVDPKLAYPPYNDKVKMLKMMYK